MDYCGHKTWSKPAHKTSYATHALVKQPKITRKKNKPKREAPSAAIPPPTEYQPQTIDQSETFQPRLKRTLDKETTDKANKHTRPGTEKQLQHQKLHFPFKKRAHLQDYASWKPPTGIIGPKKPTTKKPYQPVVRDKFAEQLMAKMGWEHGKGKGLGKTETGRVNPVQVIGQVSRDTVGLRKWDQSQTEQNADLPKGIVKTSGSRERNQPSRIYFCKTCRKTLTTQYVMVEHSRGKKHKKKALKKALARKDTSTTTQDQPNLILKMNPKNQLAKLTEICQANKYPPPQYITTTTASNYISCSIKLGGQSFTPPYQASNSKREAKLQAASYVIDCIMGTYDSPWTPLPFMD